MEYQEKKFGADQRCGSPITIISRLRWWRDVASGMEVLQASRSNSRSGVNDFFARNRSTKVQCSLVVYTSRPVPVPVPTTPIPHVSLSFPPAPHSPHTSRHFCSHRCMARDNTPYLSHLHLHSVASFCRRLRFENGKN